MTKLSTFSWRALFLILAVAIVGKTKSFGGVTYFLARGKICECQAFAIPLEKPGDIEHARRFIADPELQDRPIPVVKLVRGTDGINRDYTKAAKPEWEWHITEFVGFSDSAPLNGSITSPAQVSAHSDDWFEIYGKNAVFFVGSQIVQELGPNPLWLAYERTEDSLRLWWASLGESYRYTVESAAKPEGPWSPVPGLVWPANETTFDLSETDANTLFRVVAREPLLPSSGALKP